MACGEQPAHERAHADAADAVDENAGVKQDLECSQVREGSRAASAEHDAHRSAGQPPRHTSDVAATLWTG